MNMLIPLTVLIIILAAAGFVVLTAVPPAPEEEHPVCGDGMCAEAEDAIMCYPDCGFCGDGTCNVPEDQMTCEEDCGCLDQDADSRCDVDDNCPMIANTDQEDCDLDGIGDACDPDSSSCFIFCGNSVCDPGEDCTCADCPCSSGTICQPDGTCQIPPAGGGGGSGGGGSGGGGSPPPPPPPPSCGDGTCDATEDPTTCPQDCGCPDQDGDTICDTDDNCPLVANMEQEDCDLDGLGDACDPDSSSCFSFCGDGVCDAGEDCTCSDCLCGEGTECSPSGTCEEAVSLSKLNLVELTFDDGPDLSGSGDGREELNNLEGHLKPQLENGAHRSAITQGRYGRAAVFAGESEAIRFLNTEFLGTAFTLQVWLLPTTDQQEWIFLLDESMGVRLNDREVELAVYENGAFSFFPTGRSIPNDGQFHHLYVTLSSPLQEAVVSIDFGPEVMIDALPLILSSSEEPTFGSGFTGMMDELFFEPKYNGGRTRIDRDPSYCGPGLQGTCTEEIIIVQPADWEETFPVPVRIKTAYDPTQCFPDQPCTLLLTVSGGGQCANDYDSSAAVKAFVDGGFAVATVDVYCEFGQDDVWVFYKGSSQLIEAKNFLTTTSTLSPFIHPENYVASGCSNGATMTGHWAVREQDHPSRIFARSGGFASHHAYHTTYCQDAQKEIDQFVLMQPFPHDEATAAVADYHKERSVIDDITPTVTQETEFGMVWGVKTSPGPVCGPAGELICFEEGGGKTQGGRMLRDRWHAAEADPTGKPLTGYFIENTNKDCQHCLDGGPVGANAQIWDCMICFLQHGRAEMGEQCPDVCLEYSEGQPADPIDISCSATGCTVS